MTTPGTTPTVTPDLARQVLALFMARIELPPCRSRCQLDFDAALASDRPLERVARRLSTCLADRPPTPACATLLQLVDSVSLPRTLRDEAAALHAQLVAAEDPIAFGHHVRRLAGLINALPSQIQLEKDAVADDLVRLSGRLHDLYDQISLAADAGTAACDETAALDLSIATQVRDLEADVDGRPDLGGLGERLHQRLEAIAHKVHRFHQQAQQRLAGLRDQNDRLRDRVRDLEQETARLQAGLSAQRHRIVTDPLTGLHNRFAYDERLAQELARWQRYQVPLSLLLCDIDLFKKVNDTHGHHAGDEALKCVADLLGSALRKSDFIARYGGEEFVVLLPGAGPDRAAAVAEKLRLRVAAAVIDLGPARLRLTVSIGHASLAQRGEPGAALFERVDQALYRAKRAGRNRVCAG